MIRHFLYQRGIRKFKTQMINNEKYKKCQNIVEKNDTK